MTFHANNKKNHSCAFVCGNCYKKFTKKEDQADHICYMQPDNDRFFKHHDYDAIVTFDVESTLSKIHDSLQNNILKHDPILIYAIYICKENCINYVTSSIPSNTLTLNPICDNELCGYHSFYGQFCVYDFLAFLFKKKSKKKILLL